MTALSLRSHNASTLLALLTLIIAVPTEGPGQYSLATNKKKDQNATDTALAIAEFINGRFLVIGLNGRVEQFNLGSEDFFTTSRFSADGTQLVGLGRQGVAVLNNRFKRVWQRPLETPNAVSLALSPDGKKIAFAAIDRQTQTVRLVVATSSGPEEVFGTFSSQGAAASWIISWDPTGQQIVFSAEEQVWILDLKTRTSRPMMAGFDPTWSPDGHWIAYRSAERRLKLLDVTSGEIKSSDLDARISSMAHWSPDSKYVFVDEDYGEQKSHRACVSNSRFAVCQVSHDTCRAVYDPCGVRDWYFGWISNATQWIDAARVAERELKKASTE